MGPSRLSTCFPRSFPFVYLCTMRNFKGFGELLYDISAKINELGHFEQKKKWQKFPLLSMFPKSCAKKCGIMITRRRLTIRSMSSSVTRSICYMQARPSLAYTRGASALQVFRTRYAVIYDLISILSCDQYGKRSWARYPALWILKHVDSLPNPCELETKYVSQN